MPRKDFKLGNIMGPSIRRFLLGFGLMRHKPIAQVANLIAKEEEYVLLQGVKFRLPGLGSKHHVRD